MVSDTRDVLWAQRAGYGDHRRQPLRPGHPHAAVFELPGEQLPPRLNETKRSVYWHNSTAQGVAHGIELPPHRLSEGGSVPATNIDPPVGGEPTSDISMFDSADLHPRSPSPRPLSIEGHRT